MYIYIYIILHFLCKVLLTLFKYFTPGYELLFDILLLIVDLKGKENMNIVWDMVKGALLYGGSSSNTVKYIFRQE